jgi:hypothetical protein
LRAPGATPVAIRSDWVRLYFNVSLLECESAEVLDELIGSLGLDRYVVHRLTDRAVVVDNQQKAALTRALARRGQPYRITDLAPSAPTLPNGMGGA